MSTHSQRIGDDYFVSEEDKAHFHEHGYVALDDVIHEEELLEIEKIYQRYVDNEITGTGRDFCDMSGTYDDKPEDFALINAMLPRVYTPELQNNIYERISGSISRQLFGDDMCLDYDQFLTKKPGKSRAAFAWHQDMGYWPAQTPDTRTATCCLALTDSTRENGCLRFVPGSHKEQKIIKHKRAGENREEAHTLVLNLEDESNIAYQPVKRGSITVHDEWIIHGSDGNNSSEWRKTYVIAYRSQATVDYERSIGFTHSHNDTVNWDTLLG